MRTIEEEAKKLEKQFGKRAKDVVLCIIPECYDGSLMFWKKVYYLLDSGETTKKNMDGYITIYNGKEDDKIILPFTGELKDMKILIDMINFNCNRRVGANYFDEFGKKEIDVLKINFF